MFYDSMFPVFSCVVSMYAATILGGLWLEANR